MICLFLCNKRKKIKCSPWPSLFSQKHLAMCLIYLKTTQIEKFTANQFCKAASEMQCTVLFPGGLQFHKQFVRLYLLSKIDRIRYIKGSFPSIITICVSSGLILLANTNPCSDSFLTRIWNVSVLQKTIKNFLLEAVQSRGHQDTPVTVQKGTKY